MIIRKLKMRNIRSYNNISVEIPLGKTLFEGDIGSGKSTILMAIEFALFGLGSEKGAALIRAGEDEGEVSLIFSTGEREYTITRNLVRKKNTVSQTEGSIRTQEGLINLSPTELKETVLKILNFNEPPDPKAQSTIYRYAVFTPQEEMKTILFMRPDLRLQTLRKALKLEDYKTSNENVKEILGEIKRKEAEFRGASSKLAFHKRKILEITEDTNRKEGELIKVRINEQNVEQKLGEHKKKHEDLRREEIDLSRATSQVDLLIKSINSKLSDTSEQKSETAKLKQKEINFQTKIDSSKKLENPTDKTPEQLKAEIKDLEKQEKTLLRNETQIDTKLKEFKSVRVSGVCPTCDRMADPDEFTAKIKEKESEKGETSRKVNEVSELLDTTKRYLELKQKYEEEQRKLFETVRDLKETKERIGKSESKIKSLETEVEDLNKELEEKQESLKQIDQLRAKIRESNKVLDSLEKELRQIRDNSISKAEEINRSQTMVQEYEKLVKDAEENQQRADSLKEHQIWIEDYFIPTLDSIEKQVMLNINQDFNTHFQKWFSMLVEDHGKEARIDEEFTTIVEQDGYEQDVNYLSGGEKTSVALAYRLALNSIVQKVSTGMSSNLLILDEPTDGFSKEQLGNVREILDEIQSPQIIMVSHEKELESFADQIFRITKVQGQSRITT